MSSSDCQVAVVAGRRPHRRFDSFDQLYTGRGMSADEVAAALIATAERSLCRET
jgi:hypothetical protein